jgi:deoxyribonuclease V
MREGKHEPAPPISKWSPLIERWKAEQAELRARIEAKPLRPLPRFVAGADVAFSADRRWCYAAAVVYDREERRIIEIRHARGRVEIPYIPGFLSFREGPTLLDAIGKLDHEWGAICFDGQGYAHPRRCGLASHMAVTLDRPGVGVAKSRFIGAFDDPPPAPGSTSPLMDKTEQIGLVLRTRDNTNPLFISIGHKVDLPTSVDLVLACCTKYRIPEPTRQADIEVARLKARYAAE